MLGVAVWSSSLVIGLGWLWAYEAKSSAPPEAPAAWPTAASIQPVAGKSNLIMIAHPRCPCTSASIAELDRLMARANGAIAARVLFVRPPGASEDFVHSARWSQAAAIPGVSVSVASADDVSRFGSSTSGDVLLYGTDGRLLFSGGITASRGHEGDNAGRDSILSLVSWTHTSDSSNAVIHTSVFGCPLSDESQTADRGNTCPR